MKNLAVFFGGVSTEHDVSIITAFQTINFLDKKKYNVLPVFVTRTNETFLLKNLQYLKFSNFVEPLNKKLFFEVSFKQNSNEMFLLNKHKMKPLYKIDVAINCFHGGIGENGVFAGVLKSLCIPLVCGNFLGMALAMDKLFTKKICKAEKISVTDFVVISKIDYSYEQIQEIVEQKFGFPVVVKPASQGSSVGVSSAKNKVELEDAISVAFEYDNCVLIEPKIQNLVEYNCSVIGSAMLDKYLVSEVEKPTLKNEILSFDDKYLSGGKSAKNTKLNNSGMANCVREFPAKIPEKLTKKIQETSKLAFLKFRESGVCRIDYLYNKKTGELFLNEINTVPGSLAYYFWEKKFGGTSNYLDYLIGVAEEEFEYEKNKKSIYYSNILKNLCQKD